MKKAEQLQTGVMMVVGEVEIDLRGMEWFMENPAGMLAMQEFMLQFQQEFQYEMKLLTVDYCAWGHYYQKATHIWTSMVFWMPKGTQEGGVGRCRGKCPYGKIGDKGY